MDILSSRILLRPSDLDRNRSFYRDVLGLAVTASSALRKIPEWCSSSARDCAKSPGTQPALPGAR